MDSQGQQRAAQRHRRSDRYLQQEQPPASPPVSSATEPIYQRTYPPESQWPTGNPYVRQTPPNMTARPYLKPGQQAQQPAGSGARPARPYASVPQTPGYPTHGGQPEVPLTDMWKPLIHGQPGQAQQPMPAQPGRRETQAPNGAMVPSAYPQETSRTAMNGQPMPPASGYGWEGAQRPADAQGGWQQPYPDYPQHPIHGAVHGERAGYDDSFGEGDHRRSPGTGWMLAVFLVLIVAVLAGAVMLIRSGMQRHELTTYVSAYDDRYCQGVYVDGIHLGGMTQEEAANAVTAQALQRNNNWYVRLTYNGAQVTEITAAQLGMRVDVADVLAEAWRQGHTGTLEERREVMQALLLTPFEAYSAMPDGNTDVIDGLLEQLRNAVYRAPQDAAIVEFDPNKTNPFTIQPEVPGRLLNTENLKQSIYSMVATMQSGELEITPDEIAPNVTAAQLQQTVALRADVYTEISTRSTENRNNNISRAFELINGCVIEPGKTFSFNGVVGRRTTENGFFSAPEYVYGEETEGIGGGVCQASSTMYIAAVTANLQITKHTPHSMKVNYTDYGRDATVSWEGNRQIDFAFKNTTSGNIYITAAVQSNPSNAKRWVARVRIFGPSLGEGVTYALESEILEELPQPEDQIIRDTKGQYVTYLDEQYVKSEGRSGVKTQSWSVKYQNGTEVDRVPLYVDTYEPKPTVIYVGTKERP